MERKTRIVMPTIIRFPLWLLEMPLAILIVLIVRLIRPFFVVRFQRFISWRIGHFAANTELYLCERDARINVPEGAFMDIWYHPTNIYNKQLDRMWRRILNIGPRHLLGLVERLNSLLPGGEVHKIGTNTQGDRDVHNLFDRFPPHLSFLPEEEERGEAGLRALGVPEGAPFVCLHIRDDNYLRKSLPWRDWSYHDYRNCNIQNYILAAKELINRGYYVIRMGVVIKEPMNVVHPMIIDYAANGMRSDFMDIYLGAKCAFCISNGSGFDAVPYIFRRPIVYVDQVPLGIVHTSSPKFLITTKKHWLRGESRFMTFREIFESGAGYFFYSSEYKDMGIDLLESTPEEIAAVVLEMEARLKGVWKTTEEDEALQCRFWDIFPKKSTADWNSGLLHGDIRSRIGADFLRQHKARLD